MTRSPYPLALCILATCIVMGHAAERTIAGPHEINVYRSGKDYRENEPNILPLKDARYPDRATCNIAILTVKVRESGVHLRCDPVETARVR